MKRSTLRRWAIGISIGCFLFWTIGIHLSADAAEPSVGGTALLVGGCFGLMAFASVRFGLPVLIYLLDLEDRFKIIPDPPPPKRRSQPQSRPSRQQIAIWKRQKMLEREKQRRRQRDLTIKDNIRQACEILFRRHAQAVSTLFTEQQFFQLLQRYLQDTVPLETFKRRAQIIARTIKEFAAKTQTNQVKPKRSLAQILKKFEIQRQEIQLLSIERDSKESMLAELAYQQDRVIREFLQ